MKYKIKTSLSLVLLLPFFINAQVTEMKAAGVVDKFYKTYQVSESPYGRVDFEKRKGSWYVKILENFSKGVSTFSRPILFYDASKRSFIGLEMEKWEPSDTVDHVQRMEEIDMYNFDLQPYYGYPGWYKDVIKDYGAKAKLNDDELYALARAYSSQAIAPVTDQGGDVLPAEIYRMQFKPDAFSDMQLKRFSIFVDSAIAKYRQLSLRNSGYATRVGDSRDKYANEVMFKFHILQAFSPQGLKKMVLPKNLYKDSLLNANKVRLNACPPNAILLSFGDNDFYPILYLQQHEELRKDVYLINYSLIGLDKFIYRATLPQFESAEIKLSVDTSMYKGHTNEIIFIKDSPGSLSFPDFLQALQSGKTSDGDIAGDHIVLPRQSGEKEINIPLHKARYLLRNQWILLDMLYNLDGRKICFPNDFVDELKGLNEHLTKKEGLFIFNN